MSRSRTPDNRSPEPGRSATPEPGIPRRTFLRLGAASGLSLIAAPVLRSAGPLRGRTPPAGPEPGRTLLLIELTGGNDGLNTIVPFADDRYHDARPALRIAPAAVHRIDDALGFAPTLEGLAGLYRDGRVAVVNGVGMRVPDRSHFTSLDRWHSGDDAQDLRGDGWLGRAIETEGDRSTAIPGLALGDRALPRVFWGTHRPVACCERIAELVPPEPARKFLRSADVVRQDATAGSAADRELADGARRLLEAVSGILDGKAGGPEIPGSPLGLQLGDVLRLLRSRLDVPAILVRTGGFDTHARQDQVHPALLRNLDQTLTPFFRAALADGAGGRLLVVIYSEFGRRVAENGSRGTDHGAAAPVLVLGGGVRAGLHGTPPDLGDLLEGDIRPTCDFRRVLATALRHIGIRDPGRVLGPEGIPLD